MVEQSSTSCRSSQNSLRSGADWSLTVVNKSEVDTNKSPTDRRSVADQSPTKFKTIAERAETGRRLIGDQSATYRQLVGDHNSSGKIVAKIAEVANKISRREATLLLQALWDRGLRNKYLEIYLSIVIFS